MLKSLWNNLISPTPTVEDGKTTALDRVKLKMLIEHFPIGKKLRYFPEYQRDIVFNTIVVAYSVNDHFLYSRDTIKTDREGFPLAFMVNEGTVRLPGDKVRHLSLLVPDTSDMDRTLDYYRRATIGKGGQFLKGNAITLLADIGQRGVPTVDTQVEKRLKMTDGPYAGNGMVLLTPELNTLGINDQRQKQRFKTQVPVNLYLSGDAPPYGCVLADFSDQSARLAVGDAGSVMPPLASKDAVSIAFSLGDPPRGYVIQGVVFRRDDQSCVIHLDKLLKDGEFANIKTMDMLEIKTGLLNYGC